MDVAHLQPATGRPPPARDSSDGSRTGPEPLSGAARVPSHVGAGPRRRKARKTLVLCFDGTGEWDTPARRQS